MGLTAVLGGIAGAQEQTTTISPVIAPPSDFETELEGGLAEQFRQLQKFALEGGPSLGQQGAARNQFRSLLQQLSETGGLPGAEDVSAAQSAVSPLFAAQRELLSQSFQDQATRTGRLSAQLGRPVDDPILQAKLATSQTRQQATLSAAESGAAQRVAFQLPGARLGFASQLVQQGIGNRASILGLGQQILGQQKDFRLRSAGQETKSGGGFSGFLSGLIGGAGAGAGIAGKLSGFGGLGGGGGLGGFSGTNTVGFGPPQLTTF